MVAIGKPLLSLKADRRAVTVIEFGLAAALLAGLCLNVTVAPNPEALGSAMTMSPQ